MFEGDKLFIPKVTFFPLYFPIQQLVFSSEISIRRNLELQILGSPLWFQLLDY